VEKRATKKKDVIMEALNGNNEGLQMLLEAPKELNKTSTEMMTKVISRFEGLNKKVTLG